MARKIHADLEEFIRTVLSPLLAERVLERIRKENEKEGVSWDSHHGERGN
jgi:hypothetical protein